jgi:hypothetical protein
MRNLGTKTLCFSLVLLAGLGGEMRRCMAGQPLPKGVILNLDFQNIQEGLIPNKTLYPLFVPMNGLDTKIVNTRNMLVLREGQGLDIPHSTLLDPDGSSWIASIRVLAMTDGIIMSQCNDESGYVIYLKDGVVHATVLSGHSAVTLKERPENGIGSVLKKQVSIELKTGPNSAFLILNRNRVAYAPLQKPLQGETHRIRIGQHIALPAPLKCNPTATTTGFTGGISSLKILRQ